MCLYPLKVDVFSLDNRLARSMLLKGSLPPFFALGSFENARKSAHQPHSSSTRSVRKCCTRRNVVIRSPSDKQGLSLYNCHIVYLQPHTLKSRFFSSPSKSRQNRRNGLPSNTVRVGILFFLEGHISREHHGEGMMRADMHISATEEELSRATAVAPFRRNMNRHTTSSTAVLATSEPNLLNHGSTAACMLAQPRQTFGFGPFCGVLKLLLCLSITPLLQ